MSTRWARTPARGTRLTAVEDTTSMKRARAALISMSVRLLKTSVEVMHASTCWGLTDVSVKLATCSIASLGFVKMSMNAGITLVVCVLISVRTLWDPTNVAALQASR